MKTNARKIYATGRRERVSTLILSVVRQTKTVQTSLNTAYASRSGVTQKRGCAGKISVQTARTQRSVDGADATVDELFGMNDP